MDIVKWLDSNKEWLFRGGGVAVITGVGYLIKRYILFDRELTFNFNPIIIPLNSYRSSNNQYPLVSPNIIFRRVENAHPYLVEQICNSYKGIKVTWSLSLNSLERLGDEYRIIFHVGRKKKYHVSCFMDLEHYPMFKVMRKGKKVTVTGDILEIDYPIIYLQDCSFDF